MTRFVDSEGRGYVTSWDAAVSAARDWADGGDGWDLEALACILYEGAHFLPGAVRWYERAGVSLPTWRRDSLGTDWFLVIPALVVGVSWVRFPARARA